MIIYYLGIYALKIIIVKIVISYFQTKEKKGGIETSLVLKICLAQPKQKKSSHLDRIERFLNRFEAAKSKYFHLNNLESLEAFISAQ